MTNAQKNSSMLKAAGLWAETSVKGGQYFTGRLGSVKVLVMENRDRQSDDDLSHTLFFVEAADRRLDAAERAQERPDGQRGARAPRMPQTPSAAQRSGFPRHRDRVLDHQAPLNHDDAPGWAR